MISIFTGSLEGTSAHVDKIGEGFPMGASLIVQLLWTTPLIIIPFLVSLFRIKREDYLFVNWAIFIFIVNIFIVKWGDYTRYSMILLPAVFILAAKVLSGIKFNLREILIGL